MHVNIHRHFICLGCTDGEVFIQKKVGGRYWQAQNIRKGTKVNLLQEFWNNNHQTFEYLIMAQQSNAVHCYGCCRLTWITFLWCLYPWAAHPHLNKVNIQLSVIFSDHWNMFWILSYFYHEQWHSRLPGHVCRVPRVSCRKMWLVSAASSHCLSGSLEWQTFLPANTPMDPWLSGK